MCYKERSLVSFYMALLSIIIRKARYTKQNLGSPSCHTVAPSQQRKEDEVCHNVSVDLASVLLRQTYEREGRLVSFHTNFKSS